MLKSICLTLCLDAMNWVWNSLFGIRVPNSPVWFVKEFRHGNEPEFLNSNPTQPRVSVCGSEYGAPDLRIALELSEPFRPKNSSSLRAPSPPSVACAAA
jgi:hypothetical protein